MLRDDGQQKIGAIMFKAVRKHVACCFGVNADCVRVASKLLEGWARTHAHARAAY